MIICDMIICDIHIIKYVHIYVYISSIHFKHPKPTVAICGTIQQILRPFFNGRSSFLANLSSYGAGYGGSKAQ